MCVKFGLMYDFGSLDTGQRGSKTEPLDCFSKSIDEVILISGLKELVMVLDVCVKFGVLYDFCSPDTGSKGV